jgi:hypothetical protein
MDQSDLHEEKHAEQRISQVRGIKIEWSEENKNAWDSIRVNLELDSKEKA